MLSAGPRVDNAINSNAMSASSQKRSEEFLKISGQFKLGALMTEASHPATANLREVANGLLFEVLEYVEPRMKSDQASPPVVAWPCCARGTI
jgi:hypothetical protein